MYMHIPELGDCLGAESCVDLRPLDGADGGFDVNVVDSAGGGGGAGGRRKGKEKVEAAAVGKEFPPQISSLARADSLQSPWVMTKYYTSDGRLVIREEKVRRHEYFRAHRADGRLVMSLVPADDEDEEEEEEIGDGGDEEVVDDGEGNAKAVEGGEGIDGEDEGGEMDATAEEGLSEHCKCNRMGMSDPCGGGGGGLGVAVAVGGAVHT